MALHKNGFSYLCLLISFLVSATSLAVGRGGIHDKKCLKRYSELAKVLEETHHYVFPPSPEPLLEHYHTLIRTRVSDVPLDRLRLELFRAVHDYSHINPVFPAKSFKDWLIHAHFEKVAYRQLSEQGVTLGEILEKEFLQFAKPDQVLKDRLKLQWGSERALGEFKDVLNQYDGKKPWLFNKALKSFPAKLSQAFQGSCLAKNPVGFRNYALDMSIVLSSYALIQKGKDHPNVGNFPWEYLAASTMFSAVLGELGCRNMMASGHTIGTEIPNKTEMSIPERLSGYFKNKAAGWRAYLKWSFILNPISMGLVGAGGYARGEVNPPEDYAVRLGYYLTNDLVVGTARRTFILDPLYLSFFPWMEPAVKRLVKSGAFASGVRVATEIPTRIGIYYFNQSLFIKGDQWIKKFLEEVHHADAVEPLPEKAN